MVRVEFIFLKRCVLLLPILIWAGKAKGQQLLSFGSIGMDSRFVQRWIDPFYPIIMQPNDSDPDVVYTASAENAHLHTGATLNAKATKKVFNVSEFGGNHAHRVRQTDTIAYVSSSSGAVYRVALDRKTQERHDGKPVFIDAKGEKYIIDSKYQKKLIK